MFYIEALNKIDPEGLALVNKDGFTTEGQGTPQAYLVRSADLHEAELPFGLLAIARAGAGTNNIPLDSCAENGIVVFNTPGANANAVKELVLCSLLMASRDVVGGIDWCQAEAKTTENLSKAVEGGKSQFSGPELLGKTIGIMGLGAIGVQVANACYRLGMEVLGYDPYLSVTAALQLDRHVTVVQTPEELYQKADYITLHIPYMETTKHTIDEKALGMMKDQVRIVNLARGELVEERAIISALAVGKVARYVTDFPTPALMVVKNVVALPHLGASTPDSERNCAVMAAKELREYLLYGNTQNAVNLPDVSMPPSDFTRLCVFHKNVPNMLGQITNTLAEFRINVENMMNKSKGDYAYTMLDVSSAIPDNAADQIRNIREIIRVRILND